MQNSQLASLSEVIPTSDIQSIAKQLGSSEQATFQGIQSSIAAVIDGLSQKSGEQGFFTRILQLASSTPQNAIASALSGGSLANPASPFMTNATQFLTSIFGNRLSSLTEALGKQTGLHSAASAALLAVGGQAVLSSLGNRARSGSLNAMTLPNFLKSESNAFQGMAPLMGPQPVVSTHKVEVDPVIAQAVQREKSGFNPLWLLALLALAALLGFWWYHSHQEPVVVNTPNTPEVAPTPAVPTAVSSTGADLGAFVDSPLPNGATLHVPERGVEGKLLAFIKDPGRRPDRVSWFDFDRLLFDTGSDTLQPQSADQLDSIANILKSYPTVHLTIGGYTDNTGDRAQNQKLSQARAESVVDQLEKLGIARDRLVARGYGELHPVADNATPQGRALNRRISMLVTQK